MSNLVNDFEVRKETLRALGGDPTGLANIYEVDLEILKLIGSGGGEGIPEAPIDGVQYARQDGAWTVVESVEPGISDAPTDGTQYARQNGNWTPVVEGITDAQSDGQKYARQDGTWTPVTEGISDAPTDGTQYARQNGAWVEVEPSKVKTTNNTTIKFWTGTQDEYDLIATKDANTLYIIK